MGLLIIDNSESCGTYEYLEYIQIYLRVLTYRISENSSIHMCHLTPRLTKSPYVHVYLNVLEGLPKGVWLRYNCIKVRYFPDIQHCTQVDGFAHCNIHRPDLIRDD